MADIASVRGNEKNQEIQKHLDQQKLRRLVGAMDGIRQKYGGDAVSFARLMETGKLSESGEQEGKG